MGFLSLLALIIVGLLQFFGDCIEEDAIISDQLKKGTINVYCEACTRFDSRIQTSVENTVFDNLAKELQVRFTLTTLREAQIAVLSDSQFQSIRFRGLVRGPKTSSNTVAMVQIQKPTVPNKTVKLETQLQQGFVIIHSPLNGLVWIGFLGYLFLVSPVIFLWIGWRHKKKLKTSCWDYAGRKWLEIFVIKFPYKKDVWSGKIGSVGIRTGLAIVFIIYVDLLKKQLLSQNTITTPFASYDTRPLSIHALVETIEKFVIIMDPNLVSSSEYVRYLYTRYSGHVTKGDANECFRRASALNQNTEGNHEVVICIMWKSNANYIRPVIEQKAYSLVQSHQDLEEVNFHLTFFPDCAECHAILKVLERWEETGVLQHFTFMYSAGRELFFNHARYFLDSGIVYPSTLKPRTFLLPYTIYLVGMVSAETIWICELLFGLSCRRKGFFQRFENKKLEKKKIGFLFVTFVLVGVKLVSHFGQLELIAVYDIFPGLLSHEHFFMDFQVLWCWAVLCTCVTNLFNFVCYFIRSLRLVTVVARLLVCLVKVTEIFLWMNVLILPFLIGVRCDAISAVVTSALIKLHAAFALGQS